MNGSFERIGNSELLAATHALVRRGCAVEADLLRQLGGVAARRLYLGEACTSMFVYCVRVLHFSEAAAYKRIRAARAARKSPDLLEALRTGDLHLTGMSLLATQITDENCGELLRATRYRTADEIKRILADRQPKPDLPDCIRELPTRTRVGNGQATTPSESASPPVPHALKTAETIETNGAKRPNETNNAHDANRMNETNESRDVQVTKDANGPEEAGRGTGTRPTPSLDHAARTTGAGRPQPVKPATTSPLGCERYRVSFTASGELHGQMQELRALMRHQIPNGDLASILGHAVALLLAQVRKQKFAEVSRPRHGSAGNSPIKEKTSRQIPAAIRRAVSRRDEESCSYVSEGGRRCGAREFLEFHHLEPWARSATHSVDGIALRCRAHNDYAACRDFGDEKMARFRRRRNRDRLLREP